MTTPLPPGYAHLTPRTAQDRAKLAAGRHAAAHCLTPGMRVGLGSGTTSHWFVRALAERVALGLEIAGVPTSQATRELALELGVPLIDLGDVDRLDVTIDGADEIDPQGRMIKGGGACLLWEKIVATASITMIAVVDDTKVSEKIGRFPLPIEIIPFGWQSTRRLLQDLLVQAGAECGLEVSLRRQDGQPVVTDSGHWILDCPLGTIHDTSALAERLNTIAGVVEHGLFISIADEMIIGHPDGSTDRVVF